MIKIFRLVWYTVSVLLFISCNDETQPKSETYRNPIISGFAPEHSAKTNFKALLAPCCALELRALSDCQFISMSDEEN